MDRYGVNPNKEEFVSGNGRCWACYAVRTRLVTAADTVAEIVEDYAVPVVREGDVVFLSEKMVACTEGRAIPTKDIRPGFFARLLSRFVTRSPHGIGLAMPETMQCAIDDCGLARILLAAAVGCIGRIFGKKGWFYRVAGEKAAAVDGPCSYTIPPYNHYVVKGPADPDRTAMAVSLQLGGNLVLVVDANDLGCKILGASQREVNRDEYAALLRQNPLGQSTQCTPIGILRPLEA